MKRPGRSKNPAPRMTPEQAVENQIFHSFKYNARTGNRVFTLTLKEVLALIYQNCFYCGTGPSNKMKYRYRDGIVLRYSGLDRKDNDKGYTPSNVVPCCKRCNQIKSNLFSFEEMVALAVFLREKLPQLARSRAAQETEAQLASTLQRRIENLKKSSSGE